MGGGGWGQTLQNYQLLDASIIGGIFDRAEFGRFVYFGCMKHLICDVK